MVCFKSLTFFSACECSEGFIEGSGIFCFYSLSALYTLWPAVHLFVYFTTNTNCGRNQSFASVLCTRRSWCFVYFLRPSWQNKTKPHISNSILLHNMFRPSGPYPFVKILESDQLVLLFYKLKLINLSPDNFLSFIPFPLRYGLWHALLLKVFTQNVVLQSLVDQFQFVKKGGRVDHFPIF